MDGGAWWAAVHGIAVSRTRLSDFTFTFHFHALEKEMATHSSVEAMQTVTDILFWAPKSLQMVTVAMKLKDAWSLEEKL